VLLSALAEVTIPLLLGDQKAVLNLRIAVSVAALDIAEVADQHQMLVLAPLANVAVHFGQVVDEEVVHVI